MPVKKTTASTDKSKAKKTVAHKTTTAHKTTAKKHVAHKATTHATHKVAAKHPTVTVETKKTTKSHGCIMKSEWFMKWLFMVLLLLNLVFGVLNFMKQDSALELEEMKVGWSANLEKVMQLYESDFYKEQQSAAIQQFMAQ